MVTTGLPCQTAKAATGYPDTPGAGSPSPAGDAGRLPRPQPDTERLPALAVLHRLAMPADCQGHNRIPRPSPANQSDQAGDADRPPRPQPDTETLPALADLHRRIRLTGWRCRQIAKATTGYRAAPGAGSPSPADRLAMVTTGLPCQTAKAATGYPDTPGAGSPSPADRLTG